MSQLARTGDYALSVHYEYDAYGNTVLQRDADSSGYAGKNPFRFSTKWMDSPTGQYYYGYRYYDPTEGRFESTDVAPSTEAVIASIASAYAAVRNNSFSWVDPDGAAAQASQSSSGAAPSSEGDDCGITKKRTPLCIFKCPDCNLGHTWIEFAGGGTIDYPPGYITRHTCQVEYATAWKLYKSPLTTKTCSQIKACLIEHMNWKIRTDPRRSLWFPVINDCRSFIKVAIVLCGLQEGPELPNPKSDDYCNSACAKRPTF